MTITLYVVMILTVCAMIWANMQYKTKGVPWGRPLAGLCGVIALLLAISAMVLHMVGGRFGQKKLRRKEEQYQYIAYKFLGQEIAKKHSGSRILLIKYASSSAEAAVAMTTAQMNGLEEGMGGAATIAQEAELSSGMEEMGGPDMPGPMMDPGAMLTAEKFDQLIEDHDNCNVVVSLVGLPYDLKEMKYWENAVEDPESVPRLVLVNAHIYELRKAIESGLITIVLQNKPEIYDWKAPVPEDESVAFSNRFIIITPENVKEIAAKYPQLFMQEK